MKWLISVCVVGLLAITLLAADKPSATAPERAANADVMPELFGDSLRPNGRQVAADPTVVRSRTVRIKRDLLTSINPNDRFIFNLFEDTTFTAHLQSIKNRNTWVGSIEGEAAGTFTLVMNDVALSAIIRVPSKGIYRVRSLDNGVVVIQEIDETLFPECGIGPVHGVTAEGGDVAEGGCDDGSVIDVLVVYTALARSAAGGTAAIEAEIDMAIANTNTAYSNSLIEMQLNLVYVEELPYNEVGGYVDHLYRLTDTNDGVMDNVHNLRNEYSADMVALLVNDGEYCGIAWLMANLSPNFEQYAFSVTTWYCAAGNLTFAHELGHNQGSHHDRANAGSDPVFDYSYGYQNPDRLFRTVMSYNCPGNCPRIQHLSNPDVLYQGLPTGVDIDQPDSAHNALSINQTSFTVANFRCSMQPTGACCLIDESCVDDLTELACTSFDGTYQGDDSNCTQDSCIEVTITTPVFYDAFRGFHHSGGFDDLLDSDDSDLCHNPGITIFPTEAPITLDFFGILPNDSPASLDVTIESSADTVGLGLTFLFWNFNTTSWDVVGTDGQSLNDDTVRTFAGNPTDHVEPGTGLVLTRYEVRQEGVIFVFPWRDCVDHVFWTTTD